MVRTRREREGADVYARMARAGARARWGDRTTAPYAPPPRRRGPVKGRIDAYCDEWRRTHPGVDRLTDWA